MRDGLFRLAARRGARFLPSTLVTGLEPRGHGWRVLRDGGAPIDADAVVVATGGLSVPKTGSDGIGLAILGRLGHTIHPTYPALTPVTAGETVFTALAGVSLPVTLTARSKERGPAPPADFSLPIRATAGPPCSTCRTSLVRSRERRAAGASSKCAWTELGDGRVGRRAPCRRHPDAWAGWSGASCPTAWPTRSSPGAGIDPAPALAQLRREERTRLVDVLTRGELPWTGDEGYKKAEVTGGGVSLGEIDPRTMESRRHAGPLHLR